MPARAVPTALRELRGAKKHKLNKKEPKIDSVVLRCPDFLKGEAKKEWKRTVPILKRAGIATDADRAMLVAYCQYWAEWIDAMQKIVEEGTIIKTTHGNIVQHPSWSIANKAFSNFAKAATDLGMNPRERSKMRAEEPKKRSRFEEFVEGREKGARKE